MIVLSLIRKESYQLNTFVANRIATIQEITSIEQWRYVSTEDNPADFVSRGMDSLKLKICELWWNGPKFLMSNQYPQRQIPVAVIKDPGISEYKRSKRIPGIIPEILVPSASFCILGFVRKLGDILYLHRYVCLPTNFNRVDQDSRLKRKLDKLAGSKRESISFGESKVGCEFLSERKISS
ncbi:integrase catalytic domain-containing protein [Trichonephila clavipes]|nr:integrase catalytic domain-containing protein [Trichonephila clavipes]